MSLRAIDFARGRASRISSALGLALGLLLMTTKAQAAPSGPVSGWQQGNEPSWVSMYEYVPAKLAPNPPLLVLVHYCGGNAAGVFGEAQGGGIIAAADKYGFAIVIPQTSQNCWDIASKAALTHGGGGDSGAIVDMVKYALNEHHANPDRVYVTGTSSGAMMTEGLLAVYPDVFKGGSEFAGVPAGCWAVNDPAGQWSGPCAGGQVTHTAADWGTLVKDMDPGYAGFRPRVQLWHGEADSIISYVNQTEAIKQWTNVLGLNTSPSMTSTLMIGAFQYKRQEWLDSCGSVVLDAWTETNGPHGTDANLNAQYSIPFLGLDQDGAVDPEVAKCAGSAGGSASAGAPAAGGSSGGNDSGGAPNMAGQGNTSGGTGTGGTASTAAGGPSGASGSPTGSAGTGFDNLGAAGSAVSGSTGQGASDVPDSGEPSRPGCSCQLAQRSRAADVWAWVAVVGMGAMLRRRRTERA